MYFRIFCGLAGLLLAATQSFATPAKYSDPATAEGWAWAQIKLTGSADFAGRCGGQKEDPHKVDHKYWDVPCRQLRGDFIRDVLSNSSLRSSIPQSGMKILNARILGDIDLDNVSLPTAVSFINDHIEGSFYLRRARTDTLLQFQNVTLAGDLSADGLKSTTDFLLRNGALIEGSVRLVAAHIGGRLDMTETIVKREIYADSVQIDTDLFMHGGTFNSANFNGAEIKGQLDLEGSSFSGKLNAESLHVGRDVFLSKMHMNRAINLAFANIGSNLDLSDSTLMGLDLSSATIAGSLMLKSMEWDEKAGQPTSFDLRNAHTGRLVDTAEAWPPSKHLLLDGFTFDRLGEFESDAGPETRPRGIEWWDKHWIRLDENYSPVPYAQLAAVLDKTSDQDSVDKIRYLGRIREYESRTGLNALGIWLLKWVAGFGIGNYTFRVVPWVLALTLLGATVLWWTVPAVRTPSRGRIWCFGASLSRILPIIEINQEFSDFFNDPERKRLNGWQTLCFSVLNLLGWILGGILITALTGLTQG